MVNLFTRYTALVGGLLLVVAPAVSFAADLQPLAQMDKDTVINVPIRILKPGSSKSSFTPSTPVGLSPDPKVALNIPQPVTKSYVKDMAPSVSIPEDLARPVMFGVQPAYQQPITMDRLKPYEDKLKAYIKNANPWLSLAQNELYTDAIFQASVAHQVDFRLIAGIITIESSYRHNAVSSSGALGMGQLKVSTAQWLGVANPLEPVENIHGTAKYIRFLMDRFNQDMDKALASYFQGQGTIERYGISEISRAYLVKLSQALSQFETLADARIPS